MKNRSMIVSLIGRPNVGKSSLFNRLMKKANKALTHDMPGVTRDRHYGIARFDEINGKEEAELILVDTGGFYLDKVDEHSGKEKERIMSKFFNIMTGHAQIAIDESDLILLVVDVREGVTPFDEKIADYIRSRKKKFWVISNKYDSDKQMGEEFQFYSLGIDEENLLVVSASHGLGIDELRRRLQAESYIFNDEKEENYLLQKGVAPREEVVAKLAIIGEPNAGKSTLLNKIVGSERALVSDVAGTTVDPIDAYFDLFFGSDVSYLTKFRESFSDKKLYDQYEEFRKNNSDVYEAMTKSYIIEELPKNERHGDGEEILEDYLEYEATSNDTSEYKDRSDYLFDQVFGSGVKESAESELNDDEKVEDEQVGSLWRTIHIIDTAGIRRKSKIDDFVEEQSVFRALKCIDESDIVIYMVDATKGIAHQDRRLLDIALEKGKSIIICLNKIDLMREELKDSKSKKEWLADLRYKIPWLEFCDLVTISAKKGTNIARLKDVIKTTIMVRNKPIPTSQLNRAIYDLVERNPVVVAHTGGQRLKVRYSSMIKNAPPTFLMFTNKSKGIPANYRRYLKNGIREYFKLENTPIHLIFRTGNDLDKRMKQIN